MNQLTTNGFSQTIFLLLLVLITACEKDEPETKPDIPPSFKVSKVELASPELIAVTVVFDEFGSKLVKEKGLVWSNEPMPTLDDEKYVDFSTSSFFSTNIVHTKMNKTFFFRAYLMLNDNSVIYSDEVQIQTPSYKMISFSPPSASPGMDVTITGENFYPSSQIYLNDVRVITTVFTQTTITFTVPFGLQTDSASISIQLAEEKTTFPTKLHYKKGKWMQVNSMPEGIFLGSNRISLSAAGKGYVKPTAEASLWEYTPSSNSWAVIAESAITQSFQNGFSIGQQIYIQYKNSDRNHSMYDLDAKQWYDLAPLPSADWQPHLGVGFSFNFAGYMGLGTTNEVWKFEGLSWTRMSDFPGSKILLPIALSSDEAVYIIGGYDGTSQYLNDTWRYDPQSDTWQKRAPYPGKGRVALSGFVINNKVYIGCGASNVSAINQVVEGEIHKDFWEYDPATDRWTAVADFIEPRSNMYFFSAAAKGFSGSGTRSTPDWTNDLWEFSLE